MTYNYINVTVMVSSCIMSCVSIAAIVLIVTNIWIRESAEFTFTIFVVILVRFVFFKGENFSDGYVYGSTYQIIIVLSVVLISIVLMFVMSVWVIFIGIASHENIKETTTNANTVVIANALIWAFTLLSMTTVAFSTLGFKISTMASNRIISSIQQHCCQGTESVELQVNTFGNY